MYDIPLRTTWLWLDAKARVTPRVDQVYRILRRLLKMDSSRFSQLLCWPRKSGAYIALKEKTSSPNDEKDFLKKDYAAIITSL